ncbi:protein kinase [Nocardiopsis sp. N85]|uniref:protein kinase domain-containing protein n=1 Tax=Nocardiopsis sp. N85 TaxID=3029400 RepID=UPI00237F30EF|nr:protein kinase [Nocardiopsis sp. N85]MDE3723176.1 protein kinase [Nocardiopsis sp. N85]
MIRQGRRRASSQPVISGMRSLTTLYLGDHSLLYRAEPESGEAPFAVKLLRPSTGAGRPDEAGLWEEFSATEGVQPLLFSGVTDEGRPYAVTEYRPEGDYGEILARGERLSVDEVLAVGAAVAGALAAIHAAGFLHHAVRPADILRGETGPALIDFGSALPLDHPFPPVYYTRRDLDHTPPEELRGGAPSPASDVYRLASTMWALLAGHAPFDEVREEAAPLAEYRARILGSAVPALRREDVPEWLRAVLRRALKADPDRRTSTAEEFAAALAARRSPPEGTDDLEEGRAAVPLTQEGTGVEPSTPAADDDGYTDGPERVVTPGAIGTGEPARSAAGEAEPQTEAAADPYLDDGYADEPEEEAGTAAVLGESPWWEADGREATEETPGPPAPIVDAGPEPDTRTDDGYPDDGYLDDGYPDEDADAEVHGGRPGTPLPGEGDLPAVGLPRALRTPRTDPPDADDAEAAAEGGGAQVGPSEPENAATPSGAAPSVDTARTPRTAPLPEPAPERTPAPAAVTHAAPARPSPAPGVRPGEAAGSGVGTPPPASFPPAWNATGAPVPPAAETAGAPAVPHRPQPTPRPAPSPPFDTTDRNRVTQPYSDWGGPPERERGIGALVGPILIGLLVVVVVGAGLAVLVRGLGGPDSPAASPEASGTGDTPGRTESGAAEPPAVADPVAELAPTDIGLTDDLVAVSLTWTDNTGGESSHVVVGGPADARGTSMARTEAGESSVDVSGLNPEVEYCFQVVAVHSTDVLAPSEEICTDRGASDAN